MVEAYFAISSLGVILWVPLLLRFYRSWIQRHNPISLAICSFILMLIWFPVAGFWIITGSMSTVGVMTVSSILTVVVALSSHLAFYWSDHKFGNSRSN